jgi:hypothetical protein
MLDVSMKVSVLSSIACKSQVWIFPDPSVCTALWEERLELTLVNICRPSEKDQCKGVTGLNGRLASNGAVNSNATETFILVVYVPGVVALSMIVVNGLPVYV